MKIVLISGAYLALNDMHVCSGSDPAHLDGEGQGQIVLNSAL